MNYELVCTEGVAELSCLRELTAEDGITALTEVVNAPWFPDLRSLVIIDRGSAFGPTRDRIKALVELMERILGVGGVRIAIVVSKVVHYGIGRVLETRADHGGERVRVFLKEEAARQWLGLTATGAVDQLTQASANAVAPHGEAVLSIRILTAAACIALAFSVAGCAADEDLAEAEYSAHHGDTFARVWIPINEPRSVGTFRAEVRWPDGTTDRVEGERDGMIRGVWLSDLGDDGVLELVIAASSAGSGTYGSVHIYTLLDGELAATEVAALPAAGNTGYMGHDAFSVEDGTLRRSYPRYLEGDTNSAPSGDTVLLRYSFEDSAWVPDDERTGTSVGTPGTQSERTPE